MAAEGWLTHPLLAGIAHGFGTRSACLAEKPLLRPVQVHGCHVAHPSMNGESTIPIEADALVSTKPNLAVAVATADCVPVLMASKQGDVVAAVHAGWRGLVEGIIPETLKVLESLGVLASEVRAVIGPCIGPCCYEVDTPVLNALGQVFDEALIVEARTRPEHARIHLPRLAQQAMQDANVAAAHIGEIPDACTCCHPDRFFSWRRNPGEPERLLHYICAEGPASIDSPLHYAYG